MTELYTKALPTTDPRLGRHVVHDPRSRGFARPGTIDKSTWRTKRIRIFDPKPNPDQPNGCCTAVAKAVQFNAAGNRRRGVILDMAWVQKLYTRETQIDPFKGQMPEQDTGSNGLASCKVAVEQGDGGTYYWLFGGADEVVQAIMDGHVVSVGTRWDKGMFRKDASGQIHPGGPEAGGHQWTCRGYDLKTDRILGRCWWGEDFQDFWISRADLEALLDDDGDAHIQARA